MVDVLTRAGAPRPRGRLQEMTVAGAAAALIVIFPVVGGNQQKVVIAKSLAQEPTRGADVGEIPEMRQIVRNFAESGTIIAEFVRNEARAERILHAAIH